MSANDETLIRSHMQQEQTGQASTTNSNRNPGHDFSRGPTSGSNGLEGSRLAHNVSSRFKDYKYDGSLEKPIYKYIAEYDAVSKDFELSLEHKLRFFHTIFLGPAKRFYFSRVE